MTFFSCCSIGPTEQMNCKTDKFHIITTLFNWKYTVKTFVIVQLKSVYGTDIHILILPLVYANWF
jgi:hypothetical protein